MMDPFDQVDISAYTTIPLSTAADLVALTDALRVLTPKSPPPSLVDATEHLDFVRTEIKAEFTLRRSPDGTPEYGKPVEFDGAVDALWVCTRNRLTGWAAFTHKGLDPFIEQGGPLGELLAQNRARAERAAELMQLIFRDEGVAFTNARFAEQSKTMAAILEVIAEAEVGPELDELAAPEIAKILAEFQQRYETMVGDRLTPDDRVKRLGKLRRRLHRALGEYAVQVTAMLSRKKPKTIELVTTALAPVIELREQEQSRRSPVAAVQSKGEAGGEVKAEGEAEAEGEGEAKAEAEDNVKPETETKAVVEGDGDQA